ncbi:MAG: M13-type metalloendopeptidase [Hydrogeniiclostridium mannosilyticum]
MTGAQFDKDGSLSNWWTDEDMAAFKARAEKLIAYYDTITAFGGRRFTVKCPGEAIADMAGMKSILTLAEDTEGFDYDALFRQYATIWRELPTMRGSMIA